MSRDGVVFGNRCGHSFFADGSPLFTDDFVAVARFECVDSFDPIVDVFVRFVALSSFYQELIIVLNDVGLGQMYLNVFVFGF